MTTPVISTEQLHLDTLREYQWLSLDSDSSFNKFLEILLKTTKSGAGGLSVRGLDTVYYKAELGDASLRDGRFLEQCSQVIDEGAALKKPNYLGYPLKTPDDFVIGTVFLLRHGGQFPPLAEEHLETFAAQIITQLENRRLTARYQDILSELALKQKALIETKRLHRDFLSHLSHEMRTPLHAVLGLTELLQDDAHRIHQPKLLANLTKSSQHMLETLNVLLEHSKLESGALRLQNSSFALKEFLDETLTPFESIIEGRGLKFIKDHKVPDNAVCSADRVRLRQVINNLISNALKFTDQGSITFEVERLGSPIDSSETLYAFRVKDTGLGIHRFNHNLLFEPYRQVSGDSSKGGSGLGLSICKKIIECMQGQIGLESEYGEGSTFWFKIPLAITQSENPSAASTSQEAAEPSALRCGTILVIEDNVIARTVSAQSLEKLGYTLYTADSFDSVNKRLDERDYDLILMDLHLGDLPPKKLLAEVREKSSAPIVVVSGTKVPPADFTLGLIDDALQKPHSREALHEMAQYWILSESKTETLIQDWSESLQNLAESCGDEFAATTIQGFVQRHPSEIQKLQRYLDEENWAKLELAAHSMKSTLATLGLMELSRLVTEVEDVAPSRDRAHLESLIEQFRIDSRRTYPQLLVYVKRVFKTQLLAVS